LTVTGVRLLDHVLDVVAGAGRAVVVGPSRETLREVRWAREQPPGGGPVARLAAGLPLVMAPVVAVLAVDLPFLRPEHVLRLCAELTPGDAGVVLSDDGASAMLSNRGTPHREQPGCTTRSLRGRGATRRAAGHAGGRGTPGAAGSWPASVGDDADAR
ncbi:MAG: NTP transferase domain-containing protein, partial [Mycobacterium sp.]